jgi:hypothetical protein
MVKKQFRFHPAVFVFKCVKAPLTRSRENVLFFLFYSTLENGKM